MNYCAYCGRKLGPAANFCSSCGRQLQISTLAKNDEKFLVCQKAAKYEKISGIFWIILAAIQFMIFISAISVSYGAVRILFVAVWNFVNAWAGIEYSKIVASGDSRVPERYKNSLISIIIIIIVNMGFGGGIGVICGMMDLFVRYYVMSNAYAFDENLTPVTEKNESKS